MTMDAISSAPRSGPDQTPSDERMELIHEFAGMNGDYYAAQFDKIGNSTGFSWTFNLAAAILGPAWFGLRHLWHWGLPFLILEAFALVQLSRGLFGDLSATVRDRIAQIEFTLERRREQLADAIANNDGNVAVFERTIKSLEDAIGNIQAEAAAADAAGIWVALSGLAFLVVVKLAEGVSANTLLERRHSDWLSDRSYPAGISQLKTALSVAFVILIYAVSVVHYAFPGLWPMLARFPEHQAWRLTAINGIRDFFNYAVINGEWFFDSISYGIRVILDALEVLFVNTPWVVIAGIIILLTGLSAGPAAAIYTAAFLLYIGVLGFWEKAMTTLALLGTAACISICLGIPLGMLCARRQRLYAVVRPVMDFMQTMPSFVFMIPVIAFFGTGKPAAVITTMIFGGTPVVRLTVLGLRGVPEHVREAAIAFGASKWYLLTKVDLPLAAPSIRAGVNQTIMLSLAMVVVASLIGARGLGEDVLEALQYSSVGQGILAGFSILFCAMILNRIVQGKLT
ncbi:MAG: ABC transporter permease subunit [Boseongicola sp.]|nr:ABC transporter permease subunit [Boseongicola sp.]